MSNAGRHHSPQPSPSCLTALNRAYTTSFESSFSGVSMSNMASKQHL